MDTEQFLRALFGKVDEGWLEVTFLAPEGVALYPRLKVAWSPLPLVVSDPTFDYLHEVNRMGYGVYFGLAVRKTKKDPVMQTNDAGRTYKKYQRGHQSDALCITCLWADIDGVERKAGVDRLFEMDAPPSIMVSSGGGVHGYWLLDKPLAVTPDTMPDIRRTLEGIALALGTGGDKKVRDMARIFRLPGFTNTKPGREGAVCEVDDILGTPDSLACHRYEVLRDMYAPLGTPDAPRIDRYIPVELTDKSLPHRVQDYLTRGAPVGQRNAELFYCARAYNDAGMPMFQAVRELGARASADGLQDHEIEHTIGSAYGYAPNPPVRTSVRRHIAADDHLLRHKKGS